MLCMIVHYGLQFSTFVFKSLSHQAGIILTRSVIDLADGSIQWVVTPAVKEALKNSRALRPECGEVASRDHLVVMLALEVAEHE